MIKITLISVYESIISYGLRSLSAVLKEAGFETQMIFLPRESEGLRFEGFRYAYNEAILDQLVELVQDSGLIGLTLMTNYFDNVVQITQHLHRNTAAPIIWGGIHATVRPEECLQYADLVCVGEGEDALLELAQKLAAGEGYAGIDNIWYEESGGIVRSPLRPLPSDLDRYPYPDYDLDTSFVLHRNHIQPLSTDLLLHYLCWPYDSKAVPTYTTMMSRGCSYRCTYCCNDALRQTYHQQWHIRRRSVANFVGELEGIVSRFPGIQLIKIEDDNFVDDIDTLREFHHVYKQALDVPLFITGFQPPMVEEAKIGLLVDAGMKQVRMGIQTGSMRAMHEIYRRPVKKEHLTRAIQVLYKFTDRIAPPMYDLILDNPWETDEDKLETLYLLLDMPRPYELILFSLTFFPGTRLYERATGEGMLTDDLEQVYRRHYLRSEPTYLNELFEMFRLQVVPRWLMALLLHKRIRLLNWIWMAALTKRFFALVLLIRSGWQSLLRRDWESFKSYFRAHKGHSDHKLYQGGPASFPE
jgi:radical SAM superfamily enzyme YgiQ (UPF0313 family)